MAYPNYGYNNYGYIPGYAPGYTQPQYATNPYQNMQPVQTQAVPNTVIPPTTNKRLCVASPAYITCSPYESAYGTRNGGCGCGCGC